MLVSVTRYERRSSGFGTRRASPCPTSRSTLSRSVVIGIPDAAEIADGDVGWWSRMWVVNASRCTGRPTGARCFSTICATYCAIVVAVRKRCRSVTVDR